jgi:L-2-hydroxyglutarate oxidase
MALPWRKAGVIEVANDDAMPVLDNHLSWAVMNGMREDEIELLNHSQVRTLEPLVECAGAIYSKSDASVDYRMFTEAVFTLARQNGLAFYGGTRVETIEEAAQRFRLECHGQNGVALTLNCRLLVNASGGGALSLAHELGLAREYAQLHFRGDYWKVRGTISSQISHNIYSVPKRAAYPFLDPHFIVRADGSSEIGPNAALVPSPNFYDYSGGGALRLAASFLQRPMTPKLRLLFEREFLSLAWTEGRRSSSKKAMCNAVKRFIPSLDQAMLGERGVGGIRNMIVDKNGLIPEAVELWSERSLHILNYNSPGATGAPAYSASLVASLNSKGYLDEMRPAITRRHEGLWNFDETVAEMPPA